MEKFKHSEDGMTLLEVVIGMAIIGILSVVLYGRFHHFNVDLSSQSTTIKSHLRFAQLRALNTSHLWGIKFEQGIYWLFCNSATDTPVHLPGVGSAKLNLEAEYGLSVELVNNASGDNFFIAFDSLGRPGTEIVNTTLSVSPDDLNLLITGDSGMNSQSLTITAGTGFIP